MNKIIEFLNESNKIEDVYDADSLKQAEFAWEYLVKQKKLTVSVILKTHKILMLHQKLLPNEKGYFRKCAIWVGGHEGINWRKIPENIGEWCKNIKDAVDNGKKESQIWKEKICEEHHVIYEKIHGFVDGNGRSGRLIYNWERLKLGLPIHIIYNKDKQAYYDWFRD